MRIVLLYLLLIIPASASAQKWTAEEQEIIEFIKNCRALYWSADYDSWFEACGHEDVIEVDPIARPISSINRDYIKDSIPINRKGIAHRISHLTPLQVKVHGDTAIIYYFIEGMYEMDDGETVSWKGLSSETVIKRDGRWKVINKNDWPYPPSQNN